ncbi:MAG: hypothetical protein FJ271_29575 [Planctomycetes bacterium]|nr:hypothetical protein [Planctomycetota bacterium]
MAYHYSQARLCLTGRQEITETNHVLLVHGVDTNCRDNNGRTPLHDAVAYGYESLAEKLLANGARVDLPDKFGNTAFDLK